ncbi:hypothetical protein HE1_00039 [Holospora elegans E1]|uniref:Uncharacterized protein n=1 Tax=Holospora elegans E1 TaxID=1427503 RepID=A0A023DXS1_9PROT|nr:hypothetical protein [Holospora elegans]GAJ45730.1 hypothetical protein HE1_00039 [Holospora elegans E1]
MQEISFFVIDLFTNFFIKKYYNNKKLILLIMNYKKLLVFLVLFQSEKIYGGILDVPSTLFKYTSNLVTTRGKGCARCGTPYNVSCMDRYGNTKEIYNKPIESCFQVTAGGCRPKDGAMDEARKYCAEKGLILNESEAGKKEQARGMSNSQLKSMKKVVNNVMDNAMPVATLALGAVAGASVVGAPAIQGAISASASMRDQTFQKNALKIQKKSINQHVEPVSFSEYQNKETEQRQYSNDSYQGQHSDQSFQKELSNLAYQEQYPRHSNYSHYQEQY